MFRNQAVQWLDRWYSWMVAAQIHYGLLVCSTWMILSLLLSVVYRLIQSGAVQDSESKQKRIRSRCRTDHNQKKHGCLSDRCRTGIQVMESSCRPILHHTASSAITSIRVTVCSWPINMMLILHLRIRRVLCCGSHRGWIVLSLLHSVVYLL